VQEPALRAVGLQEVVAASRVMGCVQSASPGQLRPIHMRLHS
jgi:hypothetical protein